MFGRYQILRTLGQGGMGSVYLAHDSQLHRQVALKVPHLSDRDGTDVLQRFYREARAAAALDHPNLCPVYDVGHVDGSPYLTMAYIQGKPLAELIGQKDAWPQRQVAAVVRKLANALQEAHEKGVVHRDLKPANILVSRRKELVVVDFGLARRDGADDARLTRSGMILGTPAYMAPEQVAGEVDVIGPCSDIYALGVILYELLTGRLPFEGAVALVLGQVMVAAPEPPSITRPDVDPGLESICLKALAKKPADRFGSMSDLAEALGLYLRGGGSEGAAATSTQVEMPVPDATAAPRPTGGESLVGHFFERLVSRQSEVSLDGTEAKLSAARPPARPRRWKPVAAGAASLLALLLGVVIFMRTDEGTVRIELSDPSAQVEVKAVRSSPTDLEKSRRLSYSDRIAEVELMMTRGDRETARTTLGNCPADLSGWEWHYLSKLCGIGSGSPGVGGLPGRGTSAPTIRRYCEYSPPGIRPALHLALKATGSQFPHSGIHL